MLHKKIDGEIDPSDIWKDDVLGRHEVALEIIQIISTIKQPFVIGVSSRYGTGKSFFAKRCVAELGERHFMAVYFDAWQNDYVKEPLSGFVYTVANALKELCGPDDIAEVQELFSNAAKFIAKRTVPLAARAVTRLVIGESGAKEVSNELASLTEQIAKESIEGYENTVGEMATFRDALMRLAEKARKTNTTLQHDQVIVFVDELDRCRPDYTIEILESIKHLFNVQNFIFILMSDDQAFEASVSSVYSDKISADHYLRKFIDWKINLPQPRRDNYTRYLSRVFLLRDIEWLTDDDDFLTGIEALLGYFGQMAQMYELTLREMDQCFTIVNFVLRGLGDEKVMLPLVSVLVIMKEKDSEQYEIICHKPGYRSFEATNIKNKEALNSIGPVMNALIQFSTSENQEQMRESVNQFRKKQGWYQNTPERHVAQINLLERAVHFMYESIFNMHFNTTHVGKQKAGLSLKHAKIVSDRIEALAKFT